MVLKRPRTWPVIDCCFVWSDYGRVIMAHEAARLSLDGFAVRGKDIDQLRADMRS
jgi:hypothetical protein